MLVGLTTAAVLVLLEGVVLRNLKLSRAGFAATLTMLHGFVVVLLVVLFASPIRPEFLPLAGASVGAALVGMGVSFVSGSRARAKLLKQVFRPATG